MRLLVVGGGITGLAAAWEAVRSSDGPVEVLLVEASGRFGGKVHTERTDGLLIEHGPTRSSPTDPPPCSWPRNSGCPVT